MKNIFLTLLGLIFATAVKAQIIYTDIDPDTVITGLVSPTTGDAYFLDMDNDGTDDYELVKVTNTSPLLYFGYVQSGGSTPGANELIGGPGPSIRQVYNLDSGNVVNATGPWEMVTGGNLEFITISDFAPTTGLWEDESDGYMGVRFDSSGTTYYGWVRLGFNADHSNMIIKSYAYESSGDSIVAGAMPALPCEPPTDLAAGSITTTSAELSWTENNSATEWQIQYGTTGFALGTGTIEDVTVNPFTLSGLTDATEYDFYVRSICGSGDTSDWSTVSSFTTLIDDVSIEELVPGFGVKAYPNPTNMSVTIEINGLVENGKIALYDLMGRELLLKTATSNSKIQLDLSDFPSGCYVYRVNSENGVVSGRINLVR